MHPRPTTVLLAGMLCLLAGAAAPAQQATTASRSALPAIDHLTRQAFGMQHFDGRLLAIGPGYRAVFDQHGIEYTPALGPAAPRNRPIRLTLRTIRRGGAILFDAATADASAPSHDGVTASFARGHGIVESYEARGDGIKQDFTFARPPAGSGDLVVECTLTTDMLAPADGRHDRGISFAADDIGGVRIGEVIGIDASGQRTPGTIALEGETVRFTLPASCVDRAVYPLVLDPMIGTNLIAANGQVRDSDVAFDEVHDIYLIVFETHLSAGDVDIRGIKFDLAGNQETPLFVIRSGPNVATNPSVATVAATGDSFVAWQSAPTILGPWDVRGCRVDPGPVTTVGPQVDIATSIGSNETHPDVGGDNQAAAAQATGVLVTYQDANGIRAVKVDVPASAVVAGPLTLINSSFAVGPKITKSGGASGRYLVVWTIDNGGPRNVYGRMLGRDLNAIGSSFAIATSAADEFDPDVDGNGTDFMVAFEQLESLSSNDRDIYCRPCQWNGFQTLPSGPAVAIADQSGVDERDPAIGYLGRHFVAVWSEQLFEANYDIALKKIGTSCQDCGQKLLLPGNSGTVMDHEPAVTTRFHGRHDADPATQDQALLSWSDVDFSPQLPAFIIGLRYEAYGGGTPIDLGGGCGNGGSNFFNGPVAIGNLDLTVRCFGTGSALTLFGLQFHGATASCGACSIANAATYFLALGNGFGNSEIALPIPCDPNLQGTSMWTQWATVASGTSPCGGLPPGLELSFSNRVQATIEP